MFRKIGLAIGALALATGVLVSGSPAHAQGGARALWMQLLVSVGGILIMVGLAWLLDRARKVPDLFVDVSDDQAPQAALEPGKA